MSQLASQPASQSSESVSPVSQSVSQPTDQPTITLVHGSHEQPIEQTTQTVKAKTNQLTSQPASQGTAEQTYITTSKTKAYDPPCLAYFIRPCFANRLANRLRTDLRTDCEQTLPRNGLKSSIYKFRVYIYLIHVPFCACQNSYEFKSSINFGTTLKNFKIPICRPVFRKSY